MDGRDAWYVVLEEAESRYEVHYVEGGEEEARKAALQLARTHGGPFWDAVREIHQLGDGTWFVAARNEDGQVRGWRSFRVSVSRLVEVMEPDLAEETPEPERPGRFRRLRGRG
jgi:hypothetical protein